MLDKRGAASYSIHQCRAPEAHLGLLSLTGGAKFVNAYMNINVRVLSANAQARIRELEKELVRLRAATGASGAAGAAASRQMFDTRAIGKWGSQLQWAGRQLTYNFTLPIAAAGYAATKFYLDNERAAIRLKKVYADIGFKYTQQETDALRGSFRALSDEFAVNQAEVIDIGASWAAAGVSGLALAKATELTLQTMVLGEIEAAKATESLIAIQAQYRFSTEELSYAIAELNIIENQTGTSLGGLIEAMSRSAGTARAAGIDVKTLGAMIAALTPAAGSASQAGNALKTIISRLLSPTAEAVDLLNAMGIQTDSMAWKSANAADRIVTLSKRYEDLSDSQKAVVASTLASRFQINKFEVLMDAVATKGSFYWRALEATAVKSKVLAQATKELETVLTSQPATFDRAMTILKNAAAEVIVPLMPIILGTANAIASLAEKFSDLSPEVQKMIGIGLLFLAAIGPIARVLGSFGVLIGEVAGFVRHIGGAFMWLVGAIGPVGWAIMAVVAIVVIFKDQIWEAIQSIIKWFQNLPADLQAALQPIADLFGSAVDAVQSAFAALPQGVQTALLSVLSMVKTVALQVYEWFSYINPFARHSPSLVENVTKGMSVVTQQFSRLLQIKAYVKSVYADIKKFGQATANFRLNFDSIKRAQDFKLLLKYVPEAAGAFKMLSADVVRLKRYLAQLSDAMDAQQAVVDKWQAKFDVADAALKRQQDALDKAQSVADKYKDKLDAAKDALQGFVDTPIKGMRAMDDAIFANEMSIKRLQLEMMNLEDTGGTIDDIRAKMDALNGDIEILRGTQAELTAAGAGSDITSFYDQQIAALEDQKASTLGNLSAMNDLQRQIDALQRAADRMDLEKSLAFDPLTRQIEQAANAMNELPFAAIMAGVTAAKADIDKYGAAYDNATTNIHKHEAAVAAAQATRDALGARLDAEKAKLDKLKDAYDAVTSAIQDANAALNDLMTMVNDKANGGAGGGGSSRVSPALQNFKDAAGGNFPAVGGTATLGREGGLGDQSKAINDFTEETRKKVAELFAGVNPFGPIMDMWNKFTGWWGTNVAPAFEGWGKAIGDFFGGLDLGAKLEMVMGAIGTAVDFLVALFGDDIGDIFKIIVGYFQDLWKKVEPLLAPLWDSLQAIWPVIKSLLALVIGLVLGAVKIIFSVFKNVLGPILDFVVALVGGIIRVFTGIIDFIAGIFSGDWSRAWDGIKTIFLALWDTIISLIKNVGGVLWGIVSGIVEGIYEFFYTLWDKLVGHSLIPDMINAIVEWFAGLPQRALDAIKALFGFIVNFVTKVWNKWVELNVTLWAGIISWFQSLPGKIIDGLSALGSKFIAFITAAWTTFKNAASTGFQTVKDWFTEVPGKIVAAIGLVTTLLKTKGTEIVTGLFTAVKDKWTEVTTWFSGLFGKITSAIGNIYEKMKGLGTTIVQGIIDGVKGMAKPLTDAIGWIADHFPGSPVKRGPLKSFNGGRNGQMLGDFLRSGMLASIPDIKQAASMVSRAANVDISSSAGSVMDSMAKIPSMGSLDAVVARAEDRQRVALANAPKPVYAGAANGDRTYNFNGDLSFPNITSGADAKEFLDNLEALAKG